jgi:fibronectin type 3 domain-containing protein
VQSGSTYYYTVTSSDSSNMESGLSNETSAIIP